MPITETDIKLLPVQVKMECYDLCVDCMDPDRKKTDPTGMRRALVHDFDDGLTINWANDYRGGVTVNAVKKITGYAAAHRPFQGITIEGGMFINLNAVGLAFKGGVIRLDSQPEQAGGVKIAGDVRFGNDVTLDGRVFFHPQAGQAGTVVVTPPGQPPPPPPPPEDLGQVIYRLQQDVAALKQHAGIA